MNRAQSAVLALVVAVLGPASVTAEESAVFMCTLESATPTGYGKFGQAVSTYSGRILVAEPNATFAGLDKAGAAYLFEATGTLIATLGSPAPRKDSGFGGFYMSEKSVGLGPDHLLVNESLAKSVGAVHLFDASGTFKSSLECPDRARFERAFGQAIASDGNTNLLGTFAGGAYLFSSDGSLIASLNNADAINTWGFGRAVALAGDCAVVTDICARVAGLDGAGRALLYDRKGNLKAVISSPNPEPAPKTWIMPGVFGNAAATNGNLVAIAASRALEADGTRLGRVYLFDNEGKPVIAITAPKGSLNFGSSLAMDKDLIAIGANQSPVGDLKAAGRVFLFSLDGTEIGTLTSPEPFSSGIFGSSVALHSGILVVGEPGAATDGLEGAGKAHVFRLRDMPLAQRK